MDDKEFVENMIGLIESGKLRTGDCSLNQFELEALGTNVFISITSPGHTQFEMGASGMYNRASFKVNHVEDNAPDAEGTPLNRMFVALRQKVMGNILESLRQSQGD